MYTDLVFYFLFLSLLSLSPLSLFICFKTPLTSTLANWLHAPQPIVPSVLLPSAIPTTILLLPPSQPSFSPIHCSLFGHHPQIMNTTKTQYLRTLPHHYRPCHHLLFFIHSIFICSLLPPSSCLNPLVLSSFSSSLISSPSSMVLWPSCGPRCLWPADMSRLHSTVLHSAPSLFPCPLFPTSLWPPAPLLPLLSLKSVTPHCLFILFGTLSSFHLLFFFFLYYYC